MRPLVGDCAEYPLQRGLLHDHGRVDGHAADARNVRAETGARFNGLFALCQRHRIVFALQHARVDGGDAVARTDGQLQRRLDEREADRRPDIAPYTQTGLDQRLPHLLFKDRLNQRAVGCLLAV